MGCGLKLFGFNNGRQRQNDWSGENIAQGYANVFKGDF